MSKFLILLVTLLLAGCAEEDPFPSLRPKLINYARVNFDLLNVDGTSLIEEDEADAILTSEYIRRLGHLYMRVPYYYMTFMPCGKSSFPLHHTGYHDYYGISKEDLE